MSHWKPEAVVKTLPPGAASCGEQPPLCPWAPGGSGAHTAIRTIPSSAPSSIMKMERGSRLPSGTTSTGRTPSSRRTAMRSSSATPMSFATSCAGEGSCRMPLALLSLLPAYAHSVSPPSPAGGLVEWLSVQFSHDCVFLVGTDQTKCPPLAVFPGRCCGCLVQALCAGCSHCKVTFYMPTPHFPDMQ